jgi:hypothetical protein
LETAVRQGQHTAIAGIEGGIRDRESRGPAGYMTGTIDAAQRGTPGRNAKTRWQS